MSALSWQIERRLENGVGAILTVAVHAIVLVFLLTGRERVAVEVPPIMARVISEQTTQQQTLEQPQLRPSLTQPTLRLAQPELEIAESSATSASTMTASASPAANSAAQVETQAAAISEPRFDADYLNNPAPAYPRMSRRLREQGVVMVRVYVLPNGLPDVVELKTSSGFATLDTSALEAVRKWKFIPAQSGGRAVAAWVVVPIAFSLSV